MQKACKKEEKYIKEKKVYVRCINHVKACKSEKVQGYMKKCKVT